MAYLIISLDTELQWGNILYLNSEKAKILRDNERIGVESIYRIMALLEKYRVSATWAIVGRLFKDQSEMVERIRSSSVRQEIGYHSFSHLIIPNCTRVVAEEQIRRGVNLATDLGINLKSFVFPENKVGHIDLLKKYGFSIYRGVNLNGRNANKALPMRAYNFILSRVLPPDIKPSWKDGIWELPSSMPFYDPNFRFTLGLRAKFGIKQTIRLNGIFHINLHPEDILIDPTLTTTLEDVLNFAAKERDIHELKIITMGQLCDILDHDEQILFQS